ARGVPWFNLDKLGETSVFGSISNIHNGLGAGTGLGRIGPTSFLPAGTFDNVTVGTEITGADVDRWAVGVEQALDSANMHLYAVYQPFTADVDLVDASLNHVAAPLDDFQLFYAHAFISKQRLPVPRSCEPPLRGRLFSSWGASRVDVAPQPQDSSGL